MDVITQFLLYMIRWQLSTPTLAIFSAGTIAYLTRQKIKWPTKYEWAGAFVANLIGSIGFFFC